MFYAAADFDSTDLLTALSSKADKTLSTDQADLADLLADRGLDAPGNDNIPQSNKGFASSLLSAIRQLFSLLHSPTLPTAGPPSMAIASDIAVKKTDDQPDRTEQDEDTMADKENFSVAYDADRRTIKYPFNALANREVVRVATWDKAEAAYKVKPGTSQRDIDAALVAIGKHMHSAKLSSDKAHEISAKVNESGIGMTTTAFNGRVQFPIPPRMETANREALKMGATYNPTNTDRTRWSVLAEKGAELIIAGLTKIASVVQLQERSTSIASTLATAGSDDPRIRLSSDGETLHLRSPHLPSANEQLKKAGFNWDRATSSYAVKPGDTQHAQLIVTKIADASTAMTNALVPPTNERPGIDHPSERVASLLTLPAHDLKTVMSNDDRANGEVRRYLTHIESASKDLPAHLADGNFEEIAKALNVSPDTAVQITEMYTKLDAPVREVLAVQLEQSQGIAR
jgi:hypothetical protein